MSDRGIIADRETAAQMKVEVVPGAVVLLPVVDRSVTYPPPAEHLGHPIPKADPITVAELSLSFARNALGEAKAFLR